VLNEQISHWMQA